MTAVHKNGVINTNTDTKILVGIINLARELLIGGKYSDGS
jgi:hypothetical protein